MYYFKFFLFVYPSRQLQKIFNDNNSNFLAICYKFDTYPCFIERF